MSATNDVLRTTGTLSGPERSDGVLRAGPNNGEVPSPPPPPSPQNLSAQAIRDQIKAQQRQLREARKSDWSGKLRRVNRQYWTMAGVGVALVVGLLGCRSYQQDQRDTALALAQIGAGGTTATTAAPVVVQGMPNPLEQMKLTPQARWMIGLDGDGALLPTRSATVVAQMLGQLNPCNLFIGLNAKSTPVITATPTPGYTTLAECPATTTGPSTTLPAATVSGS